MQTISVEILNPKAKKILQNLAELNLISIVEIENSKDNSKDNFKSLLEKLRKQSSSIPTLEEITKEVEFVRENRYGK